MEFVRTFAQVGAGDVALAGGKGANLGELVAAGLPVPRGVVLTTDAYTAFTAGAGLDVTALAAEGDEAIRAAFLGARSATERIRTGDRVRVDGDAGTVVVLRSFFPGPVESRPRGSS